MNLVADNDNFSSFYVYVWRDAAGIPFYVGKGKNRRAYDLYDRTDDFLEVHGKGNCTVEIVDEFIHESQALAFEVELIERYGRREFGGLLVNKTDGGEGCSGHIKSQETIEKWRSNNIGRKRSAEACANISLGKFGYRHTVESRAKMSATQKLRQEAKRESARLAFRLSDEARAKIGISQAMRTISPARRVHSSQMKIGNKHTARTKAKISETMRGVPKPTETVANMRAAQRMKPPRGLYKGVSVAGLKWRAIIFVNGANRSLGFHSTAEAAALAYDRAALEAFGVGGCYLNLPIAANDNVQLSLPLAA